MAIKIITYGSFDMFHIGHLRLLERVSQMADEVIVGVSTDEVNTLKGKKTRIPYEQRAEIVEAISYVDLVIPESCWEQKKKDIEKYNVDVFAIGDDWKGKFDHLKDYCEVVYLPRTEEISSTYLKETLSILNKFSNKDFEKVFEVLMKIKDEFK